MTKICKNCGDIIRSMQRTMFCSGMCSEQFFSKMWSSKKNQKIIPRTETKLPKSFCNKCRKNTEQNKISDTEMICVKCGSIIKINKAD